MDTWGLTIAGVLVGFVVGLTGMGGGALMTPILIFFFGVDPLKAVSSDLVVSLFMKPVGASVHLRRGTVNMALVKWLCIGSVPGAFAGVFLLRALGDSADIENVVKLALGVALLMSCATMVVKALISLRQHYRDQAAGIRPQTQSVHSVVPKPLPTVLIGLLGGTVVGMTSVGSGSLIIVGLLLMYPLLRAGDLVGTDLVQAVPLVAAAALGHVLFGDFSAQTTVWLLFGALPGVYLGSRVSSRGQGGIIRRALVLVLLASGLKLINVQPVGILAAIVAFVVFGPVVWAVIRNTRGFSRRPQPVVGVPAWRLVWAAATGVPPRYQHVGVPPKEPALVPGTPPVVWEPDESAQDPL